MRNTRISFLIIIALNCSAYLPVLSQQADTFTNQNKQIDLVLNGPYREDQTFFNGRVWRNLHYKVREDQFLYSKVYLPGSVSIDGTTFRNIELLYDIYSDEIITHTPNGANLQLNKEMVDSFSIVFEDSRRYFLKVSADSVKGYKGYVNILYNGKSSLYVKYKKEIELLAVDRKYDQFYQTHKVYLIKDSVINLVGNRRDMFLLFGEDKAAVKSYIKKNKLFVTVKKPESLVPVVRFYDGLRK